DFGKSKNIILNDSTETGILMSSSYELNEMYVWLLVQNNKKGFYLSLFLKAWKKIKGTGSTIIRKPLKTKETSLSDLHVWLVSFWPSIFYWKLSCFSFLNPIAHF